MSLAFIRAPGTGDSNSTLALLYLTPDYTINLVARTLDRPGRSFVDVCETIDILSPPYATPAPGTGGVKDFSVPAAKRLLAVPGGVLVIGDEFSATYQLVKANRRKSVLSARNLESPKVEVNESALSTSPDNSKRRKGSVGGTYHQGTAGEKDADGSTTWSKGWRVRQGFGDVTAYVSSLRRGSSGSTDMSTVQSFQSHDYSSGRPRCRPARRLCGKAFTHFVRNKRRSKQAHSPQPRCRTLDLPTPCGLTS